MNSRTTGCALAALALVCFGSALAQSGPPPGANDFTCRPSAAHPRPVVLVHGTSANMAQNWSDLSPRLKARGWCVFALNFGETEYSGGAMYGLGPIADSARELGTFIDSVLRATGAAQVDIVGHSQGGMMPRYYLRFLDGAPRVRRLVALAPVNHGTTATALAGYFEGLPPWVADVLLAQFCGACADMLSGSPFMRRLNEGGDTVPGVKYTVIATRNDDIVTPWESQLLKGSAVSNVVLEDLCPRHRVPHEQLAFDDSTLTLVINALDSERATTPACAAGAAARR